MNPYLELDRAMLGDIYTTAEPMDNLMVLCDDCGSRTPGTPGERAAAEFLRDKLAEYGLNARLSPYSYHAWERGESTLEVVEPFQKSISCISLPYCPPADVTAPLVLLEDGGPASFERHAERIRDGIVAVSSKPPADVARIVHRTEMFHRSALGGARAFVFIGMYEGRGPETGTLDQDREALIPGISIGHEDAEFLRRQEKRKGTLRVRIRTTGRTYQATSWNVLADLPGETDDLVLVGCHYDGHDIAQGAYDPASGVVTVLEAARVLARYASKKPRRTLRAILWGTEEIGLTGAYRYVASHQDELDRIRFVLNCDIAGGPGEKGIILNQWPELEPLFHEFGEQMGGLPLGQKTHAFSDHFPYFLAGVPTGYIGSPSGRFTGRGWGHTRYDTVDKVHLRDVQEASALVARVLLRALNVEEWPAHRREENIVESLMREEAELREMRKVEEAYNALYARTRTSSTTQSR